MTAFRMGHYAFTFHASLGMVSPAAAGVAWQFTEDYLDSVDVAAQSTGNAQFTPKAVPPGATYTATYPDDYAADASWTASSGINLSSSGMNSISSTPTLAADGQVDRSLTANIVYDVVGDVSANSTWGGGSRSKKRLAKSRSKSC